MMNVELIEYAGSDAGMALSAWCSTFRELTEERIARLPSFLNSLARNGHHTPFEKSYVRFLVVADQPTIIQLSKHRVGVSINGESARYREYREDRWHIPDDWPLSVREWLDGRFAESFQIYHDLLAYLVDQGMPRTRAKETARYVLPLATETTLDISMNFRSFMHFQGLRNKPEAQKEIREIAQAMLKLVQNETNGAFKHSLAAFGYQ